LKEGKSDRIRKQLRVGANGSTVAAALDLSPGKTSVDWVLYRNSLRVDACKYPDDFGAGLLVFESEKLW